MQMALDYAYGRFRYVGIDVTPSVVAFNQKFYKVGALDS